MTFPELTPATRGRADVVAEARRWLGTPYQHQSSLRGVGGDCLGLVRGVWRAVVGPEPELLPPYRPDWAELGGEELMLEAAGRWLRPVQGAAEPGDVLLFRMARGAPVKHASILSGPERMVHAYWGRVVVESALGPWWRARLAAVFRFPEPLTKGAGREPAPPPLRGGPLRPKGDETDQRLRT